MTDCEHSPTMRLFAINTVPGADGCPICLAAENAALRDDHERACGLVAEMHAAAVGEVRGPTLGVVEDIAALRSRLAEADALLREMLAWKVAIECIAPELGGAIMTLVRIDAHLARKP